MHYYLGNSTRKLQCHTPQGISGPFLINHWRKGSIVGEDGHMVQLDLHSQYFLNLIYLYVSLNIFQPLPGSTHSYCPASDQVHFFILLLEAFPLILPGETHHILPSQLIDIVMTEFQIQNDYLQSFDIGFCDFWNCLPAANETKPMPVCFMFQIMHIHLLSLLEASRCVFYPWCLKIQETVSMYQCFLIVQSACFI